MKYRVRHVTEYMYSEAVTTSHHELHLLPRATPGQTVADESLTISPDPALRRDRLDWFGNPATHLAIHSRHTRLAVTSTFVVDVDRAPVPDDAGTWEAARELMHRIHTEFTYDTVATDVATSVDEVLRGRRGVCQDFAHVMLACLRAFGLAARYVSGYLVTNHTPDESSLIGADASHAWASVRLPGGAWLDLDPTNDVIPTDRHIAIAYGRDFGDVTPMRGVLLGGGRHELIVGVDVSPVDSNDG